MLSLGNAAFETGIKRIATEQRHTLWEAFEPLILLIVLAKSLETGDATDGVARAGFDVVHIVVVDETQVWSAFVVSGVKCYGLCEMVSILNYRSKWYQTDRLLPALPEQPW